MAVAIEEVLVRAGIEPGRRVAHTVLKGGLSHKVIRLDVDDRRYILRILDPAVSGAGLGIPMAQEIENTVRAARTGVGPKVHHVLDGAAGADGGADGGEPPAIVLEFIDGATLCQDDVRRAETIPRLAAACRRLHASPVRFVNDFSIFRKAEELLARCLRHGLGVPDGYAGHMPVMHAIERAVLDRPLPAVPCHNDLLPENFMDDGRAVRIVDYQLSGNNDPAFELGDIAAEGDYDPDRTAALTEAYFGAESGAALLARVRLYLLASNYTWSLWFAIHHGLLAGNAADAGFDYGAEAADKWAQAVRDLSDPGLGALIDTVRRGR